MLRLFERQPSVPCKPAFGAAGKKGEIHETQEAQQTASQEPQSCHATEDQVSPSEFPNNRATVFFAVERISTELEFRGSCYLEDENGTRFAPKSLNGIRRSSRV